MKTLTISSAIQGKTRSFSAPMLASIEADLCWKGGEARVEQHRPVFMVFAGADTSLRPFLANLLMGEQACASNGYRTKKTDFYECMKSQGYQTLKHGKSNTVTVYLPALFDLEGWDKGAEVNFVCMVPEDWASQQTLTCDEAKLVRWARRFNEVLVSHRKQPLAFTLDGLVKLLPSAALFRAFLDRKTAIPLLADPIFSLHLWFACMHTGLACMPHAEERVTGYFSRREDSTDPFSFARNWMGTAAFGLDKLGIRHATAFHATQFAFAECAAHTTKAFIELTKP